jgi:hypothetical protein
VISAWYLDVPDLDSGTTLTIDLGLAAQGDNLLLDASTLGQAAGVGAPTNAANGLVAAALPLEVTADDELVLTCEAASTGAGSGGTIKGWVRYAMRGTL